MIPWQVNNPYMNKVSETLLDTRDNLAIAKSLIEE
jgi:hypothetical protein